MIAHQVQKRNQTKRNSVITTSTTNLSSKIDRQALLLDLFEAEVVYSKAKRELLQTFMLNYEHVTNVEHQFTARANITNLLAERPPYSPVISSASHNSNSEVNDFRAAYAVATVTLRRRKELHDAVWQRRRVSLSNYKGGSGRILGAKLNKNNGNQHQKIIFATKFANVRKIKKRIWRKIQKPK